MTEYERLSLALLSAIARGIDLQLQKWEIATFHQQAELGSELEELRKKHVGVMMSWRDELDRLVLLVESQHPERFRPED